jgi:hypothetical protein
MLIFICNIPFVFFPGKQAILSIIDLCSAKKEDDHYERVPDFTDRSYPPTIETSNTPRPELEEKVNKSDNPCIYYPVCALFLAGIMGAAIVVSDLTLVFGIISGFSECLIIFILPSFFYLKADSMQG